MNTSFTREHACLQRMRVRVWHSQQPRLNRSVLSTHSTITAGATGGCFSINDVGVSVSKQAARLPTDLHGMQLRRAVQTCRLCRGLWPLGHNLPDKADCVASCLHRRHGRNWLVQHVCDIHTACLSKCNKHTFTNGQEMLPLRERAQGCQHIALRSVHHDVLLPLLI